MMATITSEWRKYTSTKLWWILAIVVFAGGALYAAMYGVMTALPVTLADGDVDAFTTVATISSIYNGGNTLTRILALVLGVMAMGQEYRHRTMGWAYLATPVRIKVVGAKALVVLGFGALYGVLNAIAGIIVAIPLVGYFGGSMMLDEPEVWRAIVMGIVSLALWCLLGMGLGVLIKNMVVAVVLAIAFAYMVEPLVSFIFVFQEWDLLLNLMPSGATSALMGLADNPLMMAPSEPFAWWLAGLVLLAWAAVPTAIGCLATVGKDVD